MRTEFLPATRRLAAAQVRRVFGSVRAYVAAAPGLLSCLDQQLSLEHGWQRQGAVADFVEEHRDLITVHAHDGSGAECVVLDALLDRKGTGRLRLVGGRAGVAVVAITADVGLGFAEELKEELPPAALSLGIGPHHLDARLLNRAVRLGASDHLVHRRTAGVKPGLVQQVEDSSDRANTEAGPISEVRA